MMNQSLTVIDFETTGLNPKKDRVIEMAAVRIFGGEVVSEFSTLVKFDGMLSPKITEITGIKKDDLKDALDEETAFRILNRFIGKNTLVAHNAAFDLGFLHHSFMRIAGRSFENPFICTLTIARNRFPYPHTLSEMCNRFEIELNGAHRALNDVYGCFEILKKMNEMEKIDDFINKLGYKEKYGEPGWVPNQAVKMPQN